MKYLNLRNLNPEQFAREIKKINLEEQMFFELNDSAAQNIEILIYYLQKQKIKKIIFKKDNNIDPICFRKFTNYIVPNFITIIKKTNIELVGFDNTQLQVILNERTYLNHCSINNKTPIWNDAIYKQELKKNKKHKKLLKYKTYQKLLETQKEMPFSYFNYPIQKEVDRFVFYFHMYDENQKKKILKLIKELHLEQYEKLIELISTNKINEEIYYYALGFIYKDNKLRRLTLYTKFDEKLIANNQINDFLKNKHNLDLKENYKNMWYYAIDFFNDQSLEEIKLYDEPYLFSEKLENKELEKVLHHKMCVRVLKYKNNKIVAKKYEFEYKYFRKSEIGILKQNQLYNKHSKVFAIYIENRKITKQVKYEL